MKPMKRNSEIIITLKLFLFPLVSSSADDVKENENNFRRNNIMLENRGALLQSRLQQQRNLFGNEGEVWIVTISQWLSVSLSERLFLTRD